jgi:DNA-binding HxlR family transcriptional regulator
MPSNTVFREAMGVDSKIGHPTYTGVDGRVWGRSVKMADYKQLCEKPRMNSELADELDVSTKWARRQVKWLEDRGLVQDLTEEKRNYKLYRATEKGKQILEVL